MNSDAKNSDLVPFLMLLTKSKEFLYSRNKKSYTLRKEEIFLPFYHSFVYTKPVRTKSNWKYYLQFK